MAGAGGVEVDVRRCAGDALVCCHDPYNAGVMLLTTPVSRLVELGMPTLDDVLEAIHTATSTKRTLLTAS